MLPSPATAASDISHLLKRTHPSNCLDVFFLLLRAHEESNITCSVDLLDRLVRFAPNRVAKAFRFLVDLPKLTKSKALALDFVFCGQESLSIILHFVQILLSAHDPDSAVFHSRE